MTNVLAVGRTRERNEFVLCNASSLFPVPMPRRVEISRNQDIMSVDDSFSRFQGFEQRPHASVLKEFKRLCVFMGWKSNSRHQQAMKVECLAKQLALRFNDDASKLENWQQLCVELYIDPAPPSIKQCKKVSIPRDSVSVP